MVQINYKSDFKITESSETIVSNVPFIFTYYVTKKKKYIASFDGVSEYVNCERLEDGSIEVLFNNSNLGRGTLRVERKYYITDEDFKDGIFNVVTDEATDVFLHDGKTYDPNVRTTVVPPYIKGDKGDLMTWSTMTDEERTELVQSVAEAIDPEMVMTENEQIRQSNEQVREANERTREASELQREKAFKGLKGEMQSAITAGNTAAGNAQKVVDEYDTKVAEQDSKLSQLGSEIAQSFVETFTVSPSTSATRLSVTNPKSLQNGGKVKVEINDSELPCEVYIMYKDNTVSSLVPNQWNVVYLPSNKEFSHIRVSILANSINEIKDVKIKVSVVGENFANYVSEDFAEEKNLTDAEKEIVRKNIDAAYSGDLIMPYIKSQEITNVALSTSIEVTNITIYDGISVKPEVVNTDIIPSVYVIYSDNSNSSLSYGEWNTITIPSGKSVKSIRFYYKTNSFTEQTSVTVKVTTVTQQLNTIISDIASNKINSGGLPKIKLLVLGDSYSVNGGQWIKPLINELPTGSTWKSLAVGSASLKDKYSDRTTYPYTSRPAQANSNGNNNTFACQIEKLKRLMNGTDLDNGESAIYQNEEEYPNVIIIEGGHNDSYDDNTDNYNEQLEKVVSGYAKRTSGATLENRSVCIKTPLEEVDRTCFAGAYRYLIDELFQIFPNAQIYITTCSSISYKQNPIAKKRQTIAEQQRLCADMYAINVIDWHNKGQVSPITNYTTGSGTESDPYIWGEFNGEYADTNDHLHINARGGQKYARCAALAIKDSFLNIGEYEKPL